MKINYESLSRAQVASAIGTTRQAVEKWLAKGCPVNDNGTLSLPAVIGWRIEREKTVRKPDQWLEKYRKQKAKIARLELQRLRGDLVPAGEAEAVIREAVGAAKTSFLAMPRKLAARLVGKEPREIEAEMAEEIREILNKLANRPLSDSSQGKRK